MPEINPLTNDQIFLKKIAENTGSEYNTGDVSEINPISIDQILLKEIAANTAGQSGEITELEDKVTANTSAIDAITDVYGAKNLFHVPDREHHGITFTDNGVNGYYVHGVSDGTRAETVQVLNLPSGAYRFSGNGNKAVIKYQTSSGGTQLDIPIDGIVNDSIYAVYLYVAAGETVDETIYPMLQDARVKSTVWVPWVMPNRELTENVSISQDMYIGTSGHETSVRFLKNGHIGMYIFNGLWYGHTMPSGITPIPYQRGVLIGGEGAERWLMHIESPSSKIYIHKNGGETQVPNDGTYNVFGVYIFFIQ